MESLLLDPNASQAYFGHIHHRLVNGAFRLHLNSQLSLNALDHGLAVSRTPADSWKAIREACLAFGFTHVEFKLNGDLFRDALVHTNGNPTWTIHIPLDEGSYIHLARCFDAAGAPTVLVPFADALHRHLPGISRLAATPPVLSAPSAPLR